MRIVFVNLHANEFLVKTANKMLYKQSCAFKHKYLLDYLIANPDVEVCSYVNEDAFTLLHPKNRFAKWICKQFRFLEYRLVMKKNGLSAKHVKLLKSRKQIRKDDIVVGYRHVSSSLSDMSKIDAFRAVSMIHYLGFKNEAKMIEDAQSDILFNEGDLFSYSKVFQKYLPHYKRPLLVHCFVAAPRFRRIKPFAERETRCFSTGTITYRDVPDFVDVYGDSCVQPSRKQILTHKDELEPWIACYNSDYLEDNTMKKYLPSDNIFKHHYKVWYNSTHVGQKKYFSFNMVEKMNDFKMCLVGEEIIGMPGIGFVEGMSCGCAYIGRTVGYYEDYGMKAGVHYIGYDGTLEDLKAKITYYQQPEHQDELECIANAGYEFAKEHFNGEKAAAAFLDTLVKAQAEWLSKQKIKEKDY